MAYITRLIGKEEKLIGIARLHWIYVARGLVWLGGMTLLGLALNYVMGVALVAIAPFFGTTGSSIIGQVLDGIQNYTLIFCVAFGAIFFVTYLIKVLVTEIGLTSRRVIHKTGWLFVDVRHIDLEEIRGENLDTGAFGRMLNYAYVLLDCRFLGDVRLPAIAKAEAFLKALHYHRSHTQDAVSVVVGKGNAAPLKIVTPQADIPSGPTVQVNQEAPVAVSSVGPDGTPVEPVQPPAQPPQAPPQTPPQPVPEKQPDQPPPQPAQPEQPRPEVPGTPAPPQVPPQPDITPPREIPQPAQPEIIPDQAPQKPEIQIPTQASAKGVDAQIVAQVVAQVIPEIVKEMSDKGIINNGQPQTPAGASASPDTEEELLTAFDDAAFETKAKSVAENAKSIH